MRGFHGSNHSLVEMERLRRRLDDEKLPYPPRGPV